jgi:hypothetical protein
LCSFLAAPYSLANIDAAGILLKDSKLDVKILAEVLKFPSGMAFLNPNEILLIEKDEGKGLETRTYGLLLLGLTSY